MTVMKGEIFPKLLNLSKNTGVLNQNDQIPPFAFDQPLWKEDDLHSDRAED